MRLRAENEELKEELETQSQELERKYIEQNARLKHEYEQRLDELKKVRRPSAHGGELAGRGVEVMMEADAGGRGELGRAPRRTSTSGWTRA